MTESNSPVDAALDLLVYAPVGLALTAAEEIPKLAAKGRERIGQRFMVAKMVGEFAVKQGRKELEKRLSGPPPRPRPQPAPVPEPVEADISYEDLLANPTDIGVTTAAPPASEAGDAPSAASNGAAVDNLAIPGYDSLAASQVVQRLAGLSGDELEAVGAYEASHRNRRTILTRVRQLQAG